ncbi:MAG: methionine adenosyltransferase domain-containing protein, partial [Solobacterium sp.]|nr:methionine adenosyltransferase domain-containing protein [Solobacterium sp.]
LSVNIETYGTSEYSEEELLRIINKNFDFRVGNMIDELHMRQPFYHETVNYGHFGKPWLPWEQFKKIEL